MNLIKQFNRAINRETLGSAKENLFRNLTYKEKQAVEVYDFRDVVTEDQKKWLDSHWGYDIGSKDLGLELSEKAKILSVYANFSRLLIDPNRSLTSSTLIRKSVEKNFELDINKDSVLDEEKRIDHFYLPYYKIVKEALSFVKPRYAISAHSFTKQYEDNPERKFEVGILFREKGLLSDMIESSYKREGVSYRINEPYSPKDGVCNALDAVSTWNWPEWFTDVVLLEFRNDYCSDPTWRKKQVAILAEIVEALKDKQ